jgi:catechol 1,2-dioxygenase
VSNPVLGLMGLAGIIAASVSLGAVAADSTCALTRYSILGPYYLPGAPFRTNLMDADETGERLVITGHVLAGSTCKPLARVLLDVWQANANGRYYNVDPGAPTDTKQLRLRGRLRTDNEGRYRVETILPGTYRLTPDRFRPRHIHFRVTQPGYVTLTTQVYFTGDPFLADDPFVREGQTIELKQRDGAWYAEYDFVLDEKG